MQLNNSSPELFNFKVQTTGNTTNLVLREDQSSSFSPQVLARKIASMESLLKVLDITFSSTKNKEGYSVKIKTSDLLRLKQHGAIQQAVPEIPLRANPIRRRSPPSDQTSTM